MARVGKPRVVGNADYYGRPRVQTVNDDPSETIQSDAHLTDINNILAQYGASGMEMLDETKLQFADISTFTDLQDAMNQAKLAEREFLKLPSKVREVFDHDVAVWLDTAHDEDKRDALVEAGFLEPRLSEGGGGEPPVAPSSAAAELPQEGGGEGEAVT